MLIRKNLVHEQTEGFDCVTPSRTIPQFKDECDVNTILRNYVSTGVLNHVSTVPPQFGDFTKVPADYGEALQLIQDSKDAFMTLPSDVRERFDNRPENLLKFIQDKNNLEEAVKLGLVDKPVTAETKVED